MFTKAKIALAAALVLGSGVAALANDRDGEEGGFVIPGSMDGVNPVYHHDLFGAGNTNGRPPKQQQDRAPWNKPTNSR